jgi:integrase
VDPPSIDEIEANPFTKEEAKAFLEAASKRPTFMRWIVGVGMGFRNVETLGLGWSYVDLEAELFRPEWQLQRLTWRHGCDDPHACGARLHRFEPCPAECARHKSYKRGCPKPCPKTCTRHASACPQRKEGGLVFTRPKTKKSLYDGSRHTAGTILNELGVDMPTIMEILRHTQISQTRRYVKGRSH